ncbi:MAG: hypothetical protein COA78_26790 [Blastopirellula sp.]|nr:MAG: hypothetical protein COA78_26790 [Blastopirellula sp.]
MMTHNPLGISLHFSLFVVAVVVSIDDAYSNERDAKVTVSGSVYSTDCKSDGAKTLLANAVIFIDGKHLETKQVPKKPIVVVAENGNLFPKHSCVLVGQK